MKRRHFFQSSAIAALGTGILSPLNAGSDNIDFAINGRGKGRTAKNIIFMVSDGMSSGTLNMADVALQRRDGRGSHWIDLYRHNRVNRGLMDMASASSIITDSAAASSSWGGGHRVKNGRLNMGDNGEEYTTILQKMKQAGKKVGCVTTVPITHATPAANYAHVPERDWEDDSMLPPEAATAGCKDIARQLVEFGIGDGIDVILGGGRANFLPVSEADPEYPEVMGRRKDGRNLIVVHVD